MHAPDLTYPAAVRMACARAGRSEGGEYSVVPSTVPSGIYGILLATFFTSEPALFASLIPPSFEAEFMGAALTAPDLRPICAGLGWAGWG